MAGAGADTAEVRHSGKRPGRQAVVVGKYSHRWHTAYRKRRTSVGSRRARGFLHMDVAHSVSARGFSRTLGTAHLVCTE